jgi:hypothetical protein
MERGNDLLRFDSWGASTNAKNSEPIPRRTPLGTHPSSDWFGLASQSLSVGEDAAQETLDVKEER